MQSLVSVNEQNYHSNKTPYHSKSNSGISLHGLLRNMDSNQPLAYPIHTKEQRKQLEAKSTGLVKQRSQNLSSYNPGDEKMRNFYIDLQIWKRILEDQQSAHEYQRQNFKKQFSQERINSFTTNIVKAEPPTNSARSSVASMDTQYPIISNHISKINEDLVVIVGFYRKRSLLKRALSGLKACIQQRKQKQNKMIYMHLYREKLKCEVFYSLLKNLQINRVDKRCSRQKERVAIQLRG